MELSVEERAHFEAAGHAGQKEPGDDDPIEAGRAALRSQDWPRAFSLLTAADAAGELGPEDLEMLGEAAWATAHYGASVRARERAYAAYVSAGNCQSAAVLAVMLATDYILRLELAVATGWHKTAERTLQDEQECRAHGMVTSLHGQFAMAIQEDLDAALRYAHEALDIGNRLGDLDVQMLSRTTQGRILVKQGKVEEGMALIDETMTGAVSGQLGVWAAGFVFCNTFSVCQEVVDLRRATEWTKAARRCNANEWIVPSSGHCRVHRAGVLRVHGNWSEAEEEANFGCDELQDGDRYHIGMAMYGIGEIRLRKGDLEGAEDAFHRAHELGPSAQPGLALLRLAQGKPEAGLTSIGNALADDALDRLARVTLLAAQVEIALARGAPGVAHSAAEEMTDIAQAFRTPAIEAS